MWHPAPTLKDRRHPYAQEFHQPSSVPQSRLSELLSEENILKFPAEASKDHVIKALVRSMGLKNTEAVLRAIREREAAGPLTISPHVSLLRARLESLHHIRVALGFWRKGIVLVFVGPATQSSLHLGLLVRISALFRRPKLVQNLRKAGAASAILQRLRRAEFPAGHPGRWTQATQAVRSFLSNRYALMR